MVNIGKDATLIFVPLVIGLVVQMSNVVRNADELGDSPFFLPGKLVPSLGQLNFTHGSNMVLLLGCYLLLLQLSSEYAMVRTLLTIFVLLVWLQLPLLEVADYGSKVSESRLVSSFHFHVLSTLAIAGYVWWFSRLDMIVGSVNLTLLQESDLFRNGLILLAFVSWYGFLWLLDGEKVGDNTDDRTPEEILSKMDTLLENSKEETIKRTAENDGTDPIAERHRDVIEQGADSDSTDRS